MSPNWLARVFGEGMPVEAVYRACERGVLPALQAGGDERVYWKVRVGDFLRWLDQRRNINQINDDDDTTG